MQVNDSVMFGEIIMATSLSGIILTIKDRVVVATLITFVTCYFGFLKFDTSLFIAFTYINAKVAVILI